MNIVATNQLHLCPFNQTSTFIKISWLRRSCHREKRIFFNNKNNTNNSKKNNNYCSYLIFEKIDYTFGERYYNSIYIVKAINKFIIIQPTAYKNVHNEYTILNFLNYILPIIHDLDECSYLALY